MLLRACLLALLLPLTAWAEPVQARYAAYAAGLNVLVLDAGLDLSPARYRVDLAYRTTGAFGLFVPSRQESSVQGVFEGGRAEPSRFFSAGALRGQPRVTQLDYRDGRPVLRQLLPPGEQEREPVPAALQRGTVDTLSAVAQLIRQVNQTGRCDGSVRTFDGRRLAELRARTVGFDDLPPTRRSGFAGRALHCEFEGRQLAGFKLDEDRARLQRLQRGSAWFAASAPGGTLIPVRISFHTRWFGEATMYIAPDG